MATNYTTKTAALKATTADIRKLTAKEVTTDKLFVDNKDGASTNILSLINSVDGSAVKSISVTDSADHVNLTSAGIDTNGNVKLTLSETDIASADALSKLTTRVGTAETNIGTLMGTGEGSVKKALADAKAYTNDEIDKVEAAATALTTRVTTAEGEIDTLQSTLWGSGTATATNPAATSVMGRVNALESGKLTYKVVEKLPTAGSYVPYTIYLVPDTTVGTYVEYLAIDANTVERIGTTATELDNYATWANSYSKDSGTTNLVKATVTSGVTSAVTAVAIDDKALDDKLATMESATTKAQTDATNAASAAAKAYTDAKTYTDGKIADLSKEGGAIANLAGRVTTAESDIDTLQGDMTTAESDIDTLQGDMTTAKNNITTLTGKMSTAEGEIDDLQTATALPSGYDTVQGYVDAKAKAAQDATTLTAGTNVAITDKVISVATADTYTSSSDAPISGVGVAAALATMQQAEKTTTNGIKYSQATTGKVTVDAQTATTTRYGTTKLYSGTDSTDETLAATPKAVNAALTAAEEDATTKANAAQAAAEKTATDALNAVKSKTLAKTATSGVVASGTAPSVTVTTTGSVADGLTGLTVSLTDVASASALSTLTQTVATNKTAAETAATKAYNDAKADVDALANGAVATNAANIATNTAAIATLNGSGDGSVAKAVADATTSITNAYKAADTATLTSATKYTDDAIAGITGTSGSLPVLTGRVDALESKVNNETTGLATKASQTDLTALTTRVTTAEGKITTLTSDMTTAKGNITTLTGKMTTAEGNITTLTGKMTTAEGKITTLEGKMSTAESDIDELQAQVNSLTTSSLSYVVHTGTTPPTTGLVENTIYLVPESGVESGTYVEYLCYKKNNVLTTEKIGTTSTDLSEYAKIKTAADVASTGSTYVGVKVNSGVANAVNSVTVDTTGLTNELKNYTKTSAFSTSDKSGGGITISQSAGNVTGVSVAAGEVAANNASVVTGGVVYTAIENAKTAAGTAAQDKINALDKASHGAAGVTASQTNGIVTLSVTPATVSAAGAITEGHGSNVVTATGAENIAKAAASAAVNGLDVAGATTNGITWSQADGKVSISVSADTTPTDNSTKFVTSDGVLAAIDAAKTAAATDAQTKINNLNKASHGGYGVTASQSKGIVTLEVAPATSVTGAETVVTDKAVKAYVDGINTTLTAGIKKATLTGTTKNGLTVNVTDNGTTVSMAAASTSAVGTVKIASAISTTGTVVPTAATVKSYVDTTVANLDSSVTSTGLTGLTISQENGELSGAAFSVDTKPTSGSTKAVTSGAVHAFATKVANSDATATSLGYCRVSSTESTTDGSTTYTVDNDPRITVTKTQLGSPSAVEGDAITGGSVKFVDWSKVEVAEGAFASNTSLKSFHADLENLTNGKNMFNGCTALTSFCGDLGSLTDGTNMFAGCNLDLESVIYIVDSLPTVSEGAITIGTSAVNSSDALITEARNKGWTVTID